MSYSDERLNEISGAVIGAAIDVHRALGPGLLESTYEACLAFELADRGWHIAQQKELPVIYRNRQIDCGYRIDLMVENVVIVELKAIEKIAPIHEAQLMSYLKLSGCPLGLLINFNVEILRDGIKRRKL
jgi:GxxExxY protein